MKFAACLMAVLFSLLPHIAISEAPGFTSLHQTKNWIVFRYVAASQDSAEMPDYCDVKTGNSSEFLEFSAFRKEDLACINTESSRWHFQPKRTLVGYRLGETGFYIDPGNYLPSGILFCSSRETVDKILGMLMTGYSDGASFQVLDFRGKVLASFPALGIKDALSAWHACRKWE